jgi:hypothetical protein
MEEYVSEAESKPHTRFVSGGIYRRRKSDQMLYGTMVGGSTRHNGHRMGDIITGVEIPNRVNENSLQLDEWELVAEPVPCEVLRKLEAQALEFEQLQAEVKRLAGLASGAPALDERAATTSLKQPDIVAESISTDEVAKLAGQRFDPASVVKEAQKRAAG